MSNMKSLVKKNKMLYSFCIKVKNRIPRKFYYTKDYFKIIELLKLDSSKELDFEKYRNKKLCELLKEVLEYVPYYKNLDLGITSDDVTEKNSFEIFSKLPIIEKKIVMENPEKFINIKYKKSELKDETSGGSTGEGIVLWRSDTENLLERSFYDYYWGKLGYKNSSRVVRMGCDAIKSENENPCEIIGDRLLVSPYHLNDKWIQEIYTTIVNFQGEIFHVYPSCFEYLLRYMKEKNLRLNGYKGIFLVSEVINKNLLDMCKDISPNVPVVFSYGLSENTNLAWGIYENDKISYKCDNVYGYSENLVNEEGFCEIVGTSYWNYAMPLIRYRTQDIGKIENGIITNLDGRNQEILITKQGQKVPGITICVDTFTWNYVDIIQAVQNEPGKIEFHIKPKNNFNSNIKESILKSQIDKWGEMFDISLIIDNEISKTKSGKVRLVVNNMRLGSRRE